MFKAAFAERDITPELGMGIPGYFDFRANDGVLEPLFAKAAVFEAEGICTAIVALDALFLSRRDVLDIRRKAQEMCGIKADNIFVWATHTHTGGPVSDIFLQSREKKYIRKITDCAAQAVAEAYAERRPAKLGSITGRVEDIAFVRRWFMKDGTTATNPGWLNPDAVAPETYPDETYTLTRVDDAESGEIIGFISNFGLHLDTTGGTKISADYPGILAQLVREKYGEGVKSLFLTAPCGNVNHFKLTESREEQQKRTRFYLAGEIFKQLEVLEKKISTTADVTLGCKTSRFLVPLREVSEEQVAWAKGILDGSIEIKKGFNVREEFVAKGIMSVHTRIEDSAEIEVGAMTVGDVTIVEWPGEIFIQFGRQVRRAFPGRNLIIGELGGGTMWSYIPTEEAFKYGGYEPGASNPLCGTVDLGERIASETLKLLGGD